MFLMRHVLGLRFQVSCTFDYLTRTPANIAYNYALFVVGFLLPVAIISGCYAGIIRSVFRQALKKGGTVGVAGSSTAQEREARKQEWRLAKVSRAPVDRKKCDRNESTE
jgi:r-opsin